MPDESKLPEVPESWHRLLAAVKDIIVLLSAIIAAVMGILNNGKIDDGGRKIDNGIQVLTAKADAALQATK